MIHDITDPLNYLQFPKHAYRPRDAGRTAATEERAPEMVELPSSYLYDSLRYYRTACGLSPYAFLPHDAGRTAAMEAAKKQMPEAPEFKVGDAVTMTCGCVGYVMALGKDTLTWQIVRPGTCFRRPGPAVVPPQRLKHYLRPGDKVRCLPWPEWGSLGDTSTVVPIIRDRSPMVTLIGGVAMVCFQDSTVWPLAHVERIAP